MSLRKPVWTEGLFITEHHFQQQDRYHEELIALRLQAVSGPTWGVLELKVDTDALSRGTFVLQRLRALMPDGTPIDCGGGGREPLPSSRDANSVFGPTLRSLPVYLALPNASESRGNVGKEGASTGRFSAEVSGAAEFNAGGRHLELNWARPQFSILLGNEVREGHSTIQIAELLRTQAGALVLKDTFVPPSLNIASSDFMTQSVRRVANAMSTRARALAASRRQRSEAQVDADVHDISKMLFLGVLNRSIPRFAHLLDSADTHPEAAYLALVELAGELCTFVPEADPSTLPKYNYLDLGDCFELASARALALINTLVSERFVQIPLERREDGMYLGKLEDRSILRHEFFIAARGTLSDAEIHQQLPKLSKIASWNVIGNLLNQAVNGARIQLEYRPSGALPVRPGLTFFRVQRTPEYWPEIVSTGTIAIYHPLPREAIELSLYAVDPENL